MTPRPRERPRSFLGGDRVANRLARESSPYLLLHKDNPVDWYPWGEEAFARARAEDKPIFLSVGYSTCYWCHVMERESFSEPEIAREMNEGFVCVKVDREERPDVDEIYMAATQLITRSGGWPNSVFLTPDLKPFFAGTYFPPRRRAGGAPASRACCRACARRGSSAGRSCCSRPSMVAQAMEQHLAAPAGRAAALPGAELASARAGGPRRPLRPRVGRLRAGAQVPVAGEPLLPPRARGRRRGARDARHDARPHGPRRPDGPARRRLPPLLDGRGVARAALREDAVRQRLARLALRRGLGARARRGLRPGGAPHPRLRPARDDGARGGLPLGDRRRDGRARGRLLHVDGGGARRGAAGRRRARSSAPCTASRGRRPFEGERYVLYLHTPLRRAGAHRRALRGGAPASARARPPGAPRGPLPARAAADRRQGRSPTGTAS